MRYEIWWKMIKYAIQRLNKLDSIPAGSFVQLPKHKQIQSQKTQGFCVEDFATLSDEGGRVRKLFDSLTRIKEPCVQKSKGLTPSKILGILRTGLLILLTKMQNVLHPSHLNSYLKITVY